MAQPNDSITITPGSGATVATHTVNGKEYQVVILADESGHLHQTLDTYGFTIVASASAANKDHFDLFNASGSGKLVEIRGIFMGGAPTAAVSGFSVQHDFYRTSAVGTGGTALTTSAATFPSIHKFDTASANLPAQITIRAAPTGGATVSHALFSCWVPQEETNAGTTLFQTVNLLPATVVGQRYTIREGEGFKLRQLTAGVAAPLTVYGVFTLT